MNLSAYLAILGKRVLLIDLDLQAAATSGLGIQNPDETIYNAVVDGSIEKAIMKTEIEGLFLG